MSKNDKKKNRKGLWAALVGLISGSALAGLFLKKKLEQEAAEPLTLFAEGKTDFSVVYDRALVNEAIKVGGSEDYGFRQAKRLAEELEALTGVHFSLSDDTLPEGADPGAPFEILVGRTDRVESTAFIDFIGYNEYGFALLGNKLVVAGTNLTSTAYAVDLFLDYVKQTLKTDVLGNKSLTVPADEQRFATAEQWFVDIPEFEGGKFEGTHDADLGSLMLYFTETDAADFTGYCEKLEEAGYTLWQGNEICGNLYATYVSEQAKVYLSYTDCEHAVRIITAKAGEYNLPLSSSDADYQKVCDSVMVQMACDYTRHEYGMSYVVVLENGNFVIFDGGDNRNTNTYVDVLYAKLRELCKRPDGKIVIEGWFLSHLHIDHYGTFINFCYKYGQEVAIKQVFWTLASESYAIHSVSPDLFMQFHRDEVAASVAGGLRFVQVHTGMKINLCNASFEILHTPNDLYPRRPLYFNDTSIVWRMYLCGESSLFPGDLAQRGAGVMLAKFGNYLRSDIVQVSHHGYVGCTEEFYNTVAAPVALWPINKSWYDRMLDPSYTYYKENIAAHDNARENIIAEEDTLLTLPYTKGQDC